MKQIYLYILYIIVLILFISSDTLSQLYNLKEHMNLPILITSSKVTGTGIILHDSSSAFLITAQHVLYKIDSLKMLTDSLLSKKCYLISYPRNYNISEPDTLILDLYCLTKTNNIKYSKINDIVVIKIGRYLTSQPIDQLEYNNCILHPKSTSKNAWPIENIIRYDSTMEGRDVFIFGFPTSLRLEKNYQYDFSRPLLRKGCIAGKYERKKTIIIDCPAYPCNSGGPVFMITVSNDNIIGSFIGITTEFIALREEWKNELYGLINYEWSNSGYAIVEPVDKIIELVKDFYPK